MNGVIYYNRGTACVIRLVVSIHSLRKFYNGPVTLIQDGPIDDKLVSSLKKELNVDILKSEDDDVATLVRKIQISQLSPYDVTVYIDADTLVVGSIQELFDAAMTHDIALVRFADWQTSGRTISKRIRAYEKGYPKYMKKALSYGPAINTGVYAYRKDCPMFKEWFEVAQWGKSKGYFIPDEIACQVLAPFYNTIVMDQKYNVSCNYGDLEDARIIHYHGKKHTKSKTAHLWIAEFLECVKKGVCNLPEMIQENKYMGDKRLSKFMDRKYGHSEYVNAIKIALMKKWGLSKAVSMPLEKETTLVTACDAKYVKHLQATYPNWVQYKNIERYPMLLYINGLSPDSKELDFIKGHPNLTIIPWDMPNATSQREKMLSLFVFGVARDVKTPYWVKLDADAFATDTNSLLEDSMAKFDLVGHKWNYTKPGKWIQELDKWAATVPLLAKHPDLYDPSKMEGNKYVHERTASYVQFHNSEFVRLAAELAGSRLPVPSQDTYLWYIAARLGRNIKRHNFKRFRGMSNKSELNALKGKLDEVEKTK